MSLQLDLRAFAAKANERTELQIKRIVAGVAQSLIEMSPVGDASYWKNKPPKGYTGGHFRANWDYGFNSAPGKVYPAIDKSGASSVSRVQSAMADKVMAGNVHYIINSLPYGRRLENGWSRQAPNGMVGLTVVKFKRIVKDATG